MKKKIVFALVVLCFMVILGNFNNFVLAKDTKWPIYYQSNYQTAFGDGNRTIASSGDGICVVASLLTYYSDKEYTPDTIVKENVNDNKILTNKDINAIPYIINDVYSDLNIKSSEVKYGNINLKKMDKILKKGGCVVACYHSNVKYKGTSVFTNGGHYVLIYKGTRKNGYNIMDSNIGHDIGKTGITSWSPYNEHKFKSKYIKKTAYYYYIERE